MSICPKGKISSARRDKRRTQSWRVSMPDLVACMKCGQLTLQHRVCRACGTYNKQAVLKVAD